VSGNHSINITSHVKPLNTKKTRHVTLEIQVLVWDCMFHWYWFFFVQTVVVLYFSQLQVFYLCFIRGRDNRICMVVGYNIFLNKVGQCLFPDTWFSSGTHICSTNKIAHNDLIELSWYYNYNRSLINVKPHRWCIG